MAITYFVDTTVSFGDYSFETGNIFSATIALMVATAAVYLVQLLINKSATKQQTYMLLAILAIGGLTVVFRNETFIYLKPTVFNWVFSAVVIGVQVVKGVPAAQLLMGTQMKLPASTWRTISHYWAGHFFVVGLLNLVVVYSFSEATWVSYKLISAFAYTLIMLGVTIAIAYPHLKETDPKDE